MAGGSLDRRRSYTRRTSAFYCHDKRFQVVLKNTVGLTAGVLHEHATGDGVVLGGRDGNRGGASVLPNPSPVSKVSIYAVNRHRDHAVRRLAVVDHVCGRDGGEQGLLSSALGHDGLEGAAVGLGEGEGGLGLEGGRKLGVLVGHDEGVVDGVVVEGVVVADLGEVVRRVGRGDEGQLGAGLDVEAAVSVHTEHAGGGHGDGAGRAGDEPFVVIIRPFKVAIIIAVAFEGTADADSDRMFVLADFAHA